MIVAELMTPTPVTVAPSDTLQTALERMEAGRFRQVPVVDEDRLVACNIEIDSRICYQSACLEQPSDCRGPNLKNFVRECARGCCARVTCAARG